MNSTPSVRVLPSIQTDLDGAMTIAKALVGDDSDSHARFLEVIIRDIRIVNIYVPNGNPVGSDKFAYKLAWMALSFRRFLTTAASCGTAGRER